VYVAFARHPVKRLLTAFINVHGWKILGELSKALQLRLPLPWQTVPGITVGLPG
jgi:hypothetical protein